jgi:hypothetical protein
MPKNTTISATGSMMGEAERKKFHIASQTAGIANAIALIELIIPLINPSCIVIPFFQLFY